MRGVSKKSILKKILVHILEARNEKILIKGVAGFRELFKLRKYIKDRYSVVGIDNLNNYYDTNLRKDRLKYLERCNDFSFKFLDVLDKKELNALFIKNSFNYVANLAAQPGGCYSFIAPQAYIDSKLYSKYYKAVI